MTRHLADPSAEWPATSSENVYVVFYPQNASATSCTGGYHSEGFTNSSDAGRGSSFVYAVVSECREDERGVALDDITWSLSYELIRTTTNPFVVTSPAFVEVEGGQLAWSRFADSGDGLTGSAELPYLCYLEAGPEVVSMRLDGEFEVTRSWSNAAATEQQDPCAPTMDEAYFGAAPDLTELVPLQLSDRRYETYGVRVPLHESRTVDVRLFATRPRSDFHVSAEEIPLPEDDAPTLRFEWDRQTGSDHEFLHLTITRLEESGPLGGTQIRVTSGENHDTGWTHGWMGFVAD